MNILVIGSGGREHALIYGLNKSQNTGKIYVLPGNGGINKEAISVQDIAVDDYDSIANFCQKNNIELVVVGPEDPLVAGISDALRARDIKVFGPSKAAAELEGSKEFMKDIISRYNVPTADYKAFSDAKTAKEYVHARTTPIVIKTDGLAAGKGVIIAETQEQAFTAIDEMFAGRFGDAGKRIVIEEFLHGEEVSFFAICDGKNALEFGSAQDHKAVGEGDTGPNTGGMGTYSPAPIATEQMNKQIMDEIITPVIQGMARDSIAYQGVLFAGIMVCDGQPKLLEFNIRFGDPECQVLMMRLESDLLPILLASANGDVSKIENVKFSDKSALCVVMAASGYPAEYQKNTKINNVDQADELNNVKIFHAGTKYDGDQLLANGGRVLGVTATGDDIISAQKTAYQAVDLIDWQDGFCRRDIGWRAIKER